MPITVTSVPIAPRAAGDRLVTPLITIVGGRRVKVMARVTATTDAAFRSARGGWHVEIESMPVGASVFTGRAHSFDLGSAIAARDAVLTEKRQVLVAERDRVVASGDASRGVLLDSMVPPAASIGVGGPFVSSDVHNTIPGDQFRAVATILGGAADCGLDLEVVED